MSLKSVEHEARQFLKTERPEVICISGHWGVGKTFAWNRYVREAKEDKEIGLEKYSYVSLFGLNSLDDFKYAIFENTVKSSDIGVELSLEKLRTNTNAVIESAVRKSVRVIGQTPFAKNWVGGIAPAYFSAVKDTIICVDDFERRGESLHVRDVLGLVNNLKELRRCKICLVLNDEALEEDAEKEFRKFLEKVVDRTLKFAPTADECARIALTNDSEIYKKLADCTIRLGISNIRIIKKIERSLGQVLPILSEYDFQVVEHAVHSLALFGWSTYEPTKAPSIDFLKQRRLFEVADNEQADEVRETHAAWNSLLDDYGFSTMDELDLALLNGVRDGMFDVNSIRKHAAVLDQKAKAGSLAGSFELAWDLYHDSFDNNQREVLDAIYKSFMEGAMYIAPPTMNSTVALFKALGRPEQGQEMIRHYVMVHEHEPRLFDLRVYPFASDVSDPDVIKAFNEKAVTLKDDRKPSAILEAIASTDSWSPEDINTLSALSIDEYYRMFKENRGNSLHRIVRACLQFHNISGAEEISKRSKLALKRIGEESAINARRVKRYGVDVNERDKRP